jgi:hypothetical protein
MLTVGIIFGFKANPDFVPNQGMEHYISVPVIAEVLTVHFEQRIIRVRWVDPDDNQKHTWDTSAEPFFAKYSVVPNTLETAISRMTAHISKSRKPSLVAKSGPKSTFADTTVEEHAADVFLNFQAEPNPDCSCSTCNPRAWWMILCSTCGNKRCPHATHHDHLCTGSNEPGQVGSSWENYKLPGAETP